MPSLTSRKPPCTPSDACSTTQTVGPWRSQRVQVKLQEVAMIADVMKHAEQNGYNREETEAVSAATRQKPGREARAKQHVCAVQESVRLAIQKARAEEKSGAQNSEAQISAHGKSIQASYVEKNNTVQEEDVMEERIKNCPKAKKWAEAKSWYPKNAPFAKCATANETEDKVSTAYTTEQIVSATMFVKAQVRAVVKRTKKAEARLIAEKAREAEERVLTEKTKKAALVAIAEAKDAALRATVDARKAALHLRDKKSKEIAMHAIDKKAREVASRLIAEKTSEVHRAAAAEAKEAGRVAAVEAGETVRRAAVEAKKKAARPIRTATNTDKREVTEYENLVARYLAEKTRETNVRETVGEAVQTADRLIFEASEAEAHVINKASEAVVCAFVVEAEKAKNAKVCAIAETEAIEDIEVAKAAEEIEVAEAIEDIKVAKAAEEIEVAEAIQEIEVAKAAKEIEVAEAIQEIEVAKAAEEIEVVETRAKHEIFMAKPAAERATHEHNLTEAKAALARQEHNLAEAKAALARHERNIAEAKAALARHERNLAEAKAALARHERHLAEAKAALSRHERVEAKAKAAAKTANKMRQAEINPKQPKGIIASKAQVFCS